MCVSATCFTYSSQRGRTVDPSLVPVLTRAMFACSDPPVFLPSLCCLHYRNNLTAISLCLSSLFLIGDVEYAVSRQKQIKSALISLMTNEQWACVQKSLCLLLAANKSHHGGNPNQICMGVPRCTTLIPGGHAALLAQG